MPRPRLETAVRPFFEGRIIQIDEEILVTWRMMIGDAQKRRIRFPVPNSLIAAAAFARGLTVVTRNVRDFVPLGVPVFNPWTGQSFNTPA